MKCYFCGAEIDHGYVLNSCRDTDMASHILTCPFCIDKVRVAPTTTERMEEKEEEIKMGECAPISVYLTNLDQLVAEFKAEKAKMIATFKENCVKCDFYGGGKPYRYMFCDHEANETMWCGYTICPLPANLLPGWPT